MRTSSLCVLRTFLSEVGEKGVFPKSKKFTPPTRGVTHLCDPWLSASGVLSFGMG